MLTLCAPASAQDARLRDLSAAAILFDAGAGNVLAGDQVVFATPRRVYGWPVTGGRGRSLAQVPARLGPADNELIFGTGYVRVAAAQPGRVALIRDGGPDFFPGFEPRYGKQLLVGPPAGPFADPTGCGEATGGPVAFDGDRIAYRAAPARDSCEVSAVDGQSLVIRDLADANRVEAVVPLPEDARLVTRVELAGSFVAFSGRSGRLGSKLKNALVVTDLRTGEEVLRLPPKTFRTWALDADGTLAEAVLPGVSCRRSQLRLHAPGDVQGQIVAGRPCDGLLDLDAGRLRFAESHGRTYETVELDTATQERRVLATTAGGLLDADAEHLVVDDPTCATTDARVVALDATPAVQAETKRCLRRLQVPKTVRAGKPIPIRATCPGGCRLEVRGRVGRDQEPPIFEDPELTRSGTFYVMPEFAPLERGQVVRLRVISDEPAVAARTRRFRIRVR